MLCHMYAEAQKWRGASKPICSDLTVRSYYTHYASLAVLVYLTKRALERTRNCIGYGTRLNNILQHGTKYSTIQLISDT